MFCNDICLLVEHGGGTICLEFDYAEVSCKCLCPSTSLGTFIDFVYRYTRGMFSLFVGNHEHWIACLCSNGLCGFENLSKIFSHFGSRLQLPFWYLRNSLKCLNFEIYTPRFSVLLYEWATSVMIRKYHCICFSHNGFLDFHKIRHNIIFVR